MHTGYGLEGAIPDITCGEIVDSEILPAFRNGDYYGGLNNATNTLMSLARGEFSAAEYGQKAKKSSGKRYSCWTYNIYCIHNYCHDLQEVQEDRIINI